MIFPIAIELPESDDQCYGVVVPDLAGCFSSGDTLEDALKNANEAIALHLDGMAEDGEDLPQVLSIAEHQKNPEFEGFIWGLVEVDLSAFLGKAEKINVTLPCRLIAKIDEKVNSNKSVYKNRSHYLALLASKDLIGG